MLPTKPKLPENEGSFFLEVKEALAACEEQFNNYSKEKAIDFLTKHNALWTDVHFMLVGQVLNDFDLEGSSLVLFHDKFLELNMKVDFDGITVE